MRVFLLAGEASGDRLGAALMAGLKSLETVEFAGVCGPLMQAQGMTSLFPMDELSVVGIAEILPKYMALRRRLDETVAHALAFEPDVIITIDSPEFSLRLAKKVKAVRDIRCVHYVAPSVWAWRPKRADKLPGVVDQVLALLPFEPPLIEAAGVACDFVGHPVVTEPVAKPQEVADFKARHDLGDGPSLLVLPGSRGGEVSRLGPRFGAALQDVCAARPDLRVILPTTGPRAAQVREMARDWPGNPLIIAPDNMSFDAYTHEKMCAFAAADRALAASGTVSLELAAADTPMLIAYDASWLSRVIIARMLLIDTLTLVNLVSDTRAVPECLGADCTPEKIAPAVLQLFDDASDQRAAMHLTMERLGRGGDAPGLRAAKAVLARLN
ncbi:MAG: lipid-A-disaccharide synthase [Pseudomonadota bacterium]